MVLEKTLESPLDCKRIKPILWLLDAKSQLTGKDPDTGKDCRQTERWAAENEMVG